MKRLKTNDEVIVISGKDKGKRGKINRFKGQERVLVSGINLVKKHVKPNPQKNIKGGIETKEAYIHESNIALFNPDTKKADKVSFVKSETGRKMRVFRSTQKPVDIV